MSQFFAQSQSIYIAQMRQFLGRRHPAVKALARYRPEGTQGRGSNLPPEAIAELETAVNQKAAACEALDTAFSERLEWACDYAGIGDATLARQLVGGWKKGAYFPSRLDGLATQLNVSKAWLQYGGEDKLTACCHVGVRVGEEMKQYKEQLYGKTIEALEGASEGTPEHQVNARLEQLYIEWPDYATLCRRAGGRWLVHAAALLFVPWQPVFKHQLARRFWPDEVEAIIAEELDKHDSVYAAWKAVEQRCKELGLAHPQKISLYKRAEKLRQRLAEFGADAELARSIAPSQGKQVR